MKTISLHLGTETSNVLVDVDLPHATFRLIDHDGATVSRQTTSLHAFMFARRLMDAVTAGLPKPPPRSSICDLCGRKLVDTDDPIEFRLPDGRHASVHCNCMIELLVQRRRERTTGQTELFTVGGEVVASCR